MATHALPPGSVNGSVNLPRDDWRAFGRLAYIEGETSGARLRRLIAADLAAARARGMELVRDSRQLVLELATCLLIVAGLMAATAAAVIGQSELRRPAIHRVARPVRVIRPIRSHRAPGRRAELTTT